MANKTNFMSVVVFLLLMTAATVRADSMIVDFEQPWHSERIVSYPGEDQQPNGWRFDANHGAENSACSLYLYGNTWKMYDLSTESVTIDSASVWNVYLYAPSHGSIQGFGIKQGANELIYILEAAESPPTSDPFITAYAGWKNTSSGFQQFRLPVGEDWADRFDMTGPVTLDYLLFINDEDTHSGNAYFDRVEDITDSEPHTPIIDVGPDISADIGQIVMFSVNVTDPDSTAFTYEWDFGDGETSEQPSVTHRFLNPGTYNVLCRVTDETNRTAMDSLHVTTGDAQPVASMLFAGDYMFARRYEDADENGIPGDNDGSLILPGDQGQGARNIGHHTRCFASDMRIVNLETPLTDEGWPHPTKSITFRSRPDSVAGLTENNVDLVSLSNNHLIDYMSPGLSETLDVLADPSAVSPFARNYPIKHVGGGENRQEATLPDTICVQGLRIGFVGLCAIVGHPANEQPFFQAGYDKPGVLYLNEANLKRAVNACRAIADVTVVLFHGGVEYADEPSDYIQPLAREAIDLGADLVVCTHPHVSQGIEFRNDKPIIYSLGNFIFEQKYQKTMMTWALEAQADANGICRLDVIPVYVENWEPKFVLGDAGNRLITRILGLSEFLGTTIIPDPFSNRGIVQMPGMTFETSTENHQYEVSSTYHSTAHAYLTNVIKLDSTEHLSRINSLHQISGNLLLGHDLFMFGNCEDEDLDPDEMEGTGWNLAGSASARISDYNPHQGNYCLRLRRYYSNYYPIEVESRWRMPVTPSKLYMLSGYYRTLRARNLTAGIRFYYYPYTYESYWDEDITVLGPINGDTDWTYFEKFLVAPANLEYASIHLSLSPPDEPNQYGYAYFDEVRFVEWHEIASPVLPLDFANPGDTKYLALRTTSSNSGTINIDLTSFSAEDSDADGIFDIVEDANGNARVDPGETDPETADTDCDGLDDGEEFRFGADNAVTNGCNPDTDGDGYDDYLEFQSGTDPNDDQSHPLGPTATPSSTPYFTPTPQPPTPTPSTVPSMTNTPTRIPTHTQPPTPSSSPTPPPSETPAITPTPTSTAPPAPSATETPVSSPTPTPPIPTNTPGITHTPEASPTPTPTPNVPIHIQFQISDSVFRPEETCFLNLEIVNSGAALNPDLYVLLEAYGLYWSFPSWSLIDTNLDFLNIDLQPGEHRTLTVLDPFTMPATAADGPFYFYAAMFEAGYLDSMHINSNIAIQEFYIGSI